MNRAMTLLSALVLSLMLVVAGCNPTRQKIERMQELQSFANAYFDFYQAHGIAPSSLADVERAASNFPWLAQEIRADKFKVVWRAHFDKDANENDKFMLGYSSDAAEHGGWVLHGGGSVSVVDAEKFKTLSQIETHHD